MAFGGAATYAPVLEYPAQPNAAILNVTGLTLAANAAFPPVAANADTGQLSSNTGVIDAVPANTLSLPSVFGPGPDNWSATDVAALNVSVQNVAAGATVLAAVATLVANVNPAPAGSGITNANVMIQFHNKTPAVAAGALAIMAQAAHSLILAARS